MSQPFTLRVIDAETRAELRDVAVHRATVGWNPRGPQVEPLTDATRLASGASPLALPAPPVHPANRAEGRTTELVVAVRGFALKQVEVELVSGGELEVALDHGGALTVAITGIPDGVTAELRLHSVDATRRDIARIVARHPDRPSPAPPPAMLPRSFTDRLASLDRGPDRGLALDRVYASDLLWRDSFHVVPLDGRSTCAFEQLPAGTWAASLVSRIDGVGYCFGLALVKVEADQQATVELRWQDRAAPKRVHVHGTVAVAPGWESVASETPWEARLAREELDPALGSDGMYAKEAVVPLVSTEEPSRFRFDFGDHPPGLYMLVLPRFGMALPMHVHEARECHVAIPRPIEVELTLLPPLGERAVTDRCVEWAIAPDDFAMRGVAQPVEPDLDDGRFRFVMPEGRATVLVTAFGEIWPTETGAFDLRPGTQTISMRLRPAPVGISITLRDGVRALPEPWLAVLRIEREGKPVGFGSSFSPNGTTVCPRLPGPGRYRLYVSGVDGYDDPPPVDIEVLERQRNAVVIAMRRRT